MHRSSAFLLILVSAALISTAGSATAQQIIPSLPPVPTLSVSTVPSNGDINPYGVAFVPSGFPSGGLISPGDILVSNFNNSSNLQGTGTTIVKIDPTGHQSLFFQGQNGLGLTTALGVLSAGWVLVGNLPSPTGMCTEGSSGQELGVGQGSLLLINPQGQLVRTFSSAQRLDGPWDMTIHDEGSTAQVFLSDALSGAVMRFNVRASATEFEVVSATRIASGYTHRCDPAALVVGPTGLALDAATDTLYVASAGDNAIYAVPNASSSTGDHGTGALLINDKKHLHGPLGLARATNGDLITAQGDAVNFKHNEPSEIVEFTSTGQFVAQFSIDPAAGSAFGLALVQSGSTFRFAAVDDGLNVLKIWDVQ